MRPQAAILLYFRYKRPMNKTKPTSLPLFLEKGVLLSQNSQHIWVAENWGRKAMLAQDLAFQAPFGGLCFYNPEFNFKFKDEVIVVANSKKMTADELSNQFDEPTEMLPELEWEKEESKYQDDYQKIMTRIQAGHLIKAVPFMRYKTLKPKNFNTQFLPYILKNILKHSDQQYVYGLWDNSQGFVGSTPEILVEGTVDQLQVMALAGTQESKNTDDMLKDKKLYDEHMVVVDDIAEKLAGKELSWGETHEAHYGPLKHLRTMGVLKGFSGSLGPLLSDLSPTSALGVYPKNQLSQNEDVLHVHERGAYGAPFGVLDHGFAHFIVCLRGLFWDETYLYIPVGGGVIAQSDYQTELKELNLKFTSTKNKLGL